MVSADSRVVINASEIAAQVIDGEAIIMNLTTGIYCSMDRVGAVIWGWIERGHSVADLNKLLRAVAPEKIVVRKRLEPGSLSDCQAAALSGIGMNEIVAVLGDMACDCSCWALPELNPETVREVASPPAAMIWCEFSRKVLRFGRYADDPSV